MPHWHCLTVSTAVIDSQVESQLRVSSLLSTGTLGADTPPATLEWIITDPRNKQKILTYLHHHITMIITIHAEHRRKLAPSGFEISNHDLVGIMIMPRRCSQLLSCCSTWLCCMQRQSDQGPSADEILPPGASKQVDLHTRPERFPKRVS